jgi:hypothetical protein
MHARSMHKHGKHHYLLHLCTCQLDDCLNQRYPKVQQALVIYAI